MSTVTSADGTTVAYERSSEGPAVILVDGALCYRASGPARQLAKRLAPDYTVYTYDRRGRGESGDTAPHSIEREVDDLGALIKAAGGSAYAYGISSGRAVKHFMRLVEVPAVFVAMMPLLPAWGKLKGVAHTLPYDHALLGDTASGHESPIPRWAAGSVPTLVMGGGKSPGWMQQAQVSIAEAIPGAQHRTIAGQTHLLEPDAIAPVLREFFGTDHA